MAPQRGGGNDAFVFYFLSLLPSNSNFCYFLERGGGGGPPQLNRQSTWQSSSDSIKRGNSKKSSHFLPTTFITNHFFHSNLYFKVLFILNLILINNAQWICRKQD